MTNSGHGGYVGYVLGQLRDGGELVSVFLDSQNPDTFTTGFVRAVSPRQVLLRCVTPWGMLDGFMALRNGDIIQVMHGEDFEKRMELLLKLRQQTPADEPEFDQGSDYFTQLLNIALASGCVVTVWDEHTSLTGRITALDDLRVTMAALDFFGGEAGEVNIKLRDVLLVSLGSEEEEVYRLLAQHDSAGNSQAGGCSS